MINNKRGTIIRAGMSDNECKSRCDQHKKLSFLRVAPNKQRSDKQRHLYLSYPYEDVDD